MGMKSIREDEGECWRKWYLTRRTNLLSLSGPPPKNLCDDLLNLTLCCRYVEWLLKNPRLFRFLSKNHPSQLRRLQSLLAEFDRTSRW